MCAPQKKCSLAILICGSLLLVLGLSLSIAFPFLYKTILKGQLILKPGSINHKFWLKTPIPLYLEFYLFNWTNAVEVELDKKVKPRLEQVGPFVFLEVHEREDLIYNDNFTVTFKQKRTWNFIPEMSKDPSVMVTCFNPIALTIAKFMRYRPLFLRPIINKFLATYNQTLSKTATAMEWMFDGYEDKLLTQIDKLQIPLPIEMDRFGWFHGRNETVDYDGVFNMFTGEDDIYKLGSLFSWNYRHFSKYFHGDCGIIHGYTGEVFPPFKLDNYKKSLPFFAPDACGSVNIKYSHNTTVLGIEGYKYVADESLYDNGTLFTQNSCYCDNASHDYCLPSGVLNVTKCKFGVPAYISLPHFYLADPIYNQLIDGLEPNGTLHDLTLTLEKNSGIPLEADAKIQVNLLVEEYSWIKMYKGLPRMMMPMLWVTQRTQLTPKLANLLDIGIKLEYIGPIVLWCFFGLGLLITISGGVCVWRNKKMTEQYSLKMENSDDNSSESS